MAADVRTRLSEALDVAPDRWHNQHLWGCASLFEGREDCDCKLAEFIARLVERDRQLLADVVMVEEQQREHSAKLTEAWRPDGGQASIPRLQEHAERIGGRLDALMAEVERAVALWLGEGAP